MKDSLRQKPVFEYGNLSIFYTFEPDVTCCAFLFLACSAVWSFGGMRARVWVGWNYVLEANAKRVIYVD